MSGSHFCSRINAMSRQEKILEKKKLGRPAIGKGLQFNAMLRPEMAAAIDAWIARQPEPQPTRPEAIRRLVENGLASERPPVSDAALDREIAEQKSAIAEIPEYPEPSPEAALAVMDKALAENDLVALKNERAKRKRTGRK